MIRSRRIEAELKKLVKIPFPAPRARGMSAPAVRGGFAALLIFASTFALAQTVTVDLKNGDRLTGRVLSETTNTLVLSNAWAPRLAIPLAEISRRASLSNAIAGGQAGTAGRAATNAQPTNAVQLAKVVASTNTIFTAPWLKNWHGDLMVGTDLTFSERNRQVYNAKAKITYAKDRLKSVVDYDTTYGRSEVDQTVPGTTRVARHTVTDANRMFGSWKLEYDLTKRVYVYNLAGAGYDEIRKIDLRYEVGPGVGYRLVIRTNLAVNTEVGFNYQDEEHTDGSTINTFYFRFAENAAWKITPRLTWDEKFEYTPRVEDQADYRLRFETNLRYAMLQNVFVNFSLVDIYDSQSARDVSQNDLQVRSSVGVKF